MTRLVRLTVRGFRGIPDGCLAFDGGSVVLGGGNGTGKTGFVDAVEFLYTGSVRPLTGTAAIDLKRHLPHILARRADGAVAAQFDDPPLTVVRHLSGSLELPPALRPHVQAGAKVSFILRRSQILQFIHAKPADRYRSMADLIGTEGLDTTERALKGARDALEHKLQGTQVQLAQAEQQIANVPDVHLDETEVLAQVNRLLTDLDLSAYLLADLRDLGPTRTALLQSVTRPARDARGEARARLAEELQRGVDQDQLREMLAAYMALAPTLREARTGSQMLDLLQVLRRGRDYLRATETDRCPLCRQEIEARRLLSDLVKRTAALEEVSLQQQRIDRARSDLEAALQDTSARLQAINRGLRETGIQGQATVALSNAVAMLREALRAAAPLESMEMAGRTEDELDRWLGWARETGKVPAREGTPEIGEDATERLDAALSVLQETHDRQIVAERARLELARLEGTCHRLRTLARRQERALALADAAYTAFNRVKKSAIQEIYSDLQSDLRRFYDFLHPGEGHKDLTIEVDPRKRGSSELKMGFFSQQDQDPRAFSSEGHLDSLGLCIFLAFAKRCNGDWPLLVLDDVVTSVDAAHKRRVATLLFREFGDRQLFITTQDSRWFSDLRTAQKEAGLTDGTRNLAIESWSLEEGPRIRTISSF